MSSLYPVLVVVAVGFTLFVTAVIETRFNPDGAWPEAAFMALLWAVAILTGLATGWVLGRFVRQRAGWISTLSMVGTGWVAVFVVLTVAYLVAFPYLRQSGPDPVAAPSLTAALDGTIYLAILSVGVPASMAAGLWLVKRGG
jgi:cation transporter-like permease